MMDEQNFKTNLLEDGTLQVTGCDVPKEELVIPEKINDKKVTVIGPMAFSGWKELKRLVIPEGIRTIQHNAFSGCSQLSSVVLPSGLINIEDFAFNGCTSLPYLIVPASVKKAGLKALPETLLVVDSWSPLIPKLRKGTFLYQKTDETQEELEKRIAEKQRKQKRKNRLGICLFCLFFAFGIAMIIGLLTKNSTLLTIGWIGGAVFLAAFMYVTSVRK